MRETFFGILMRHFLLYYSMYLYAQHHVTKVYYVLQTCTYSPLSHIFISANLPSMSRTLGGRSSWARHRTVYVAVLTCVILIPPAISVFPSQVHARHQTAMASSVLSELPSQIFSPVSPHVAIISPSDELTQISLLSCAPSRL
jgi:hypothetical protein